MKWDFGGNRFSMAAQFTFLLFVYVTPVLVFALEYIDINFWIRYTYGGRASLIHYYKIPTKSINDPINIFSFMYMIYSNVRMKGGSKTCYQ